MNFKRCGKIGGGWIFLFIILGIFAVGFLVNSVDNGKISLSPVLKGNLKGAGGGCWWGGK